MSRQLRPCDLLSPDGRPRPLSVTPIDSRSIVREFGFEHRGPERVVDHFSFLPARTPNGKGGIFFLRDLKYAEQLSRLPDAVVITRDVHAEKLPGEITRLVCPGDPRSQYYLVFESLVRSGAFERLSPHVSPSASIGAHVEIGSNVYIDDDAVIEAGVVIGSNTYVGRKARIKPNCVVGTDGFERFHDGTRHRILAHAGGVWLADGVHLGACCCVDKGILGDFTFIGESTCFDNHVHFAHSSVIGRDSSLTARVEVSGSVHIGDGVWVGPGSCMSNMIRIGDAAYIGTGSVIVRDIPPHTLAYGAPARAAGRVCACRGKLEANDAVLQCPICGRTYRLDGDDLVEL